MRNVLLSLTPVQSNLLHYALDTEITAREERATWWRRNRGNEAMATWIEEEVTQLRAMRDRLPLLPLYTDPGYVPDSTDGYSGDPNDPADGRAPIGRD